MDGVFCIADSIEMEGRKLAEGVQGPKLAMHKDFFFFFNLEKLDLGICFLLWSVPVSACRAVCGVWCSINNSYSCK